MLHLQVFEITSPVAKAKAVQLRQPDPTEPVFISYEGLQEQVPFRPIGSQLH